jgi:hypothetical protein
MNEKQMRTPGPWEVGKHAWPEQIGCCPLTGRPFSIHSTDNRNVAAATTRANAHLIAAAPDMASQLEDGAAELGSIIIDVRAGKFKNHTLLADRLQAVADRNRAALAKATGGN